MRIAELRARERYEDILASTLSRHLSIWFNGSYEVSTAGAGQLWREHRLFSAYITGNASAAVRRFLADQVRYTSVRHRQLPQFVIGTAAATRLGALVASSKGFYVTPEVPLASNRIIMPGNRRIRFFDLSESRSRVVLKDSFSSDAIDAELAARGDGQSGPFPPILAYDRDAGWFTEPMIDGLVLARMSSAVRRRRCLDMSLRTLSAWAAPQRKYVTVEAWWDDNRTARAHLGALLPDIDVLLGQTSHIEVQPSHGDLQPGNILVDRKQERVWLLDWEFYGIRSTYYDPLVLLTGLRWPERAGRALERALDGCLHMPMLKSLSLVERQRAIVVALIEDMTLRLRGWDGSLEKALPPTLPVLLRLIRRMSGSDIK